MNAAILAFKGLETDYSDQSGKLILGRTEGTFEKIDQAQVVEF